MTEINEKIERLLQFKPISLADRDYLEAELMFEAALAEQEKRWSDSIRLKKRLAELRTGKAIVEPPKTDAQRKLDDEIERASREGRVRDLIVLKRRRAGFR